MTYLDYQATTPLAPEALDAMLPWLRADQPGGHANPHSAHREGRRAKAAVEVAREQVAALLPPGGRVVFTSGATEALNWAIKGTGGALVTLATEHAAVLDTAAAEERGGRDVRVLAVGRDGCFGMQAADPLQTGDRPAGCPPVSPFGLVAAMLVNNEIGVVQPVAALAEAAHRADALFLCDAVQGYGRVPIPDAVDLVAISAHKIHGPKGIGALWIRNGVALAPLLHGGDQEDGRSGTLSPALCAGFGAAARLMVERADVDAAHVEALWRVGIEALGPGWIVNGSEEHRYRGNLNVRLPGLDVARLTSDLRDIAFSAGSACASGSGRSSHVLRAIGLGEAEARSSIRLGFGRYTTETDLAGAIGRIDAAAQAQRVAA
ncbi:cysteine desulfurase family protein [Sphingomonas bacterium]|uniref:cysteine desulfurase family protein n=1 Tax=Sphingomonas bacterium TaxID=1895847 RepID=UPI0015767601|nr:cysteine desulfurase family protein [Sphingomonas bacterium]